MISVYTSERIRLYFNGNEDGLNKLKKDAVKLAEINPAINNISFEVDDEEISLSDRLILVIHGEMVFLGLEDERENIETYIESRYL